MPSFSEMNTASQATSSSIIDEVLGQDKLMPIAVIGMACRLPGDASGPEKLWEMVSRKRHGWSEIPKSRFDINAFYHPDPDRNGTINVKAGHFIKQDISAFDAPFFSISPAEAKAMDPQQRMVMESAYESMESAGIPMEKLAGSETSCYVGCFSRDYNELLARDPETAPTYVSTGNGAAILSNRISYFFDLKGPSLTVDTACSSSLVALHLACQSLRTGESKTAIVGGTNLIFSPDVMIAMSNVHFLGPDAHCFTYDSRANGYSRGEGIATIILKPLADAIRDNDTVRAVIRGTASNQDGRTAGIMLPSQEAQVSLINRAYAEAGCDPAAVGYFEAHGTGTPAGDPLEAGAIGATLGKHRGPKEEDKLYVGSIKTNIGHAEGCSGLASFIKTVFALEKGAIPPNLWFEKANERMDFDAWRIRVPTELVAWPQPGVRRASINSFGFGGANAHVILDDAYHYMRSRGIYGSHRTSPIPLLLESQSVSNGTVAERLASSPPASDDGYASASVSGRSEKEAKRHRIFLWSTHEESIMKNNAETYAEHLLTRQEQDEDTFLNDLAYTLCNRRSNLALKSFIIAYSKDDLAAKLKASRAKPIRSEAQEPRIGFVFTGQGAQWWGVGRELLDVYWMFKRSIEAADQLLSSLGCSWSLVEELTKDEKNSRIDFAAISQPICTAVQLALCDLLADWGIKPKQVIGHSSGEIGAAYAAGILPFESAMKVAYFRGLYSSQINSTSGQKGAMLAVGLSETDAQARIDQISPQLGRAVVACINSPCSVTLSGDIPAIAQLEDLFKEDSIFARRLKVDIAYHSHHMEAVSKLYLDSLEGLEVVPIESRPDVEMVSSVSTESASKETFDGSYWVRNMLSAVRFSEALQHLCIRKAASKRSRKLASSHSVDVLVEIGPHAALAGPIKQILAVPKLQKARINYHASLVRGKDACETMLELSATLFAKGTPVNLDKINFPTIEEVAPQVLVDLPSYPWNHSKTYWAESRLSTDYRFRDQPRNDFLGAPVVDWNSTEPRWRNFIRCSEQPWVREHEVQGSIIYPGAGYICMALQAAEAMVPVAQRPTVKGYTIREVKISRALVIPQTEAGVEVMFSLRPFNNSSQSSSDVWNEFRVFSLSVSGWSEHCRGLLSTSYHTTSGEVDAGREDQEALGQFIRAYRATSDFCNLALPAEKIYKNLAGAGLEYGPRFRNLSNVRYGQGKAIGTIEVPDTASIMPHGYEHEHILHPATMDCFVQILFPALSHSATDIKEPFMPTFIREFYVSNKISSTPGHKFSAISNAKFVGYREATASIAVCDEGSLEPILRVDGITCTALTSSSSSEDCETEADEKKKLCFTVSWNPDLDLLSKERAEDILMSSATSDAPSEYVAKLEMLAHYYYEQVLDNISEDKVLSMSAHHQKYYRYMQHQHQKVVAGKVAHQTPEWLQFDRPEVIVKMQDIITEVRSTDYEGQMICRMGERLTSIFNKEVDPLALMLQDELLYNYYSCSLGIENSYAHLSHYVRLLSNKNPDLNFLEIGAGTGGATVPVLEALGGSRGTYPRFGSYTYTDVSTGFFEKAEEKFKDWKDLMTFKRLDIESNPTDQGFEAGKYDVVLAFNVLHATQSIDKTMANVRSLLKPGGKLLLLEITNVLNRVFLPFGTLPGWWASEDSWREWGPTMSEEDWSMVLKRNGFGSMTSSTADHRIRRDQTGRLMIVEAVEEKEIGSSAFADGTSVIIATSDHPSTSATEKLEGRLSASLTELGISTSTVRFSQLPNVNLKGKVIISLAELAQPLLRDLGARDFDSLKDILRDSRGLLWVTVGATQTSPQPELALFHGLARTLRAEHEGLPIVTLDLSTECFQNADTSTSHVAKVFEAVFRADNPAGEMEYCERDGILTIKRCIEAAELNARISGQTKQSTSPVEILQFAQPDRPLTLAIEQPGLLDTLTFVDDVVAYENLPADYVEIAVKAVGLNFRDIMVSMGQLTDNFLGCECSGVISKVGPEVTRFRAGDRVTTWTLGAYNTFARNPEALVQPIPDDMDFAVAASLPIVYCTAYYGLIDQARLRQGETVLIHAAAGGVGQAAIMLCQLFGAEVFVTVGTNEKKKLIMDTYNIPEDRIFSSRDLTFEKGIMRMTAGRGVDVILNCLSGEALKSTWKCIADFGRFIEIGKKDIQDNTRLDMAPFIRNVMFSSVDLTVIFRKNKPLGAKLLADVIELLQQGKIGEVKPIKKFSFAQVEEAFRYMQAGKHSGKIVLVPSNEDMVKIKSRPKTGLQFEANASYLIVGGFGGLGRSLATWMVSRGAKNLILMSRSGAASEAATNLVKELTEIGVNVAPLACNILNKEELKEALGGALQTMPAIRGVIQGAMVLEDRIFDNMPLDVYTKVVQPKVHGTRNLHDVTLDQPLDFFVMLASAAGMVGDTSQGNYAAANAFQDALAHNRIAHGLPATTIDLGMVRSVGYVAENQGAAERNLARWGFLQIEEVEFLAMMEVAMGKQQTQESCQLVTGVGTQAHFDRSEGEVPHWFRDPCFSHLHKMRARVLTADTNKGPSLQQQLKACLSVADAAEITAEAIAGKLSKSLMIPRDEIDLSRPTSAYGVDSLVAVEVRNWVLREMKADLPVFEILQAPSLEALARNVADKCGLLDANVVREVE